MHRNRSDRNQPDRSQPDRSRPDRSRPDRNRSDRSRPDHPEIGLFELARLLDAVTTREASSEAAATARHVLHHLPELRQLWHQLHRPTPLGATGLELVQATLVAELEVAWPEGEEVARKLIAGVEGGAERLRELDRMAEELGGRRSYESWREGVLGLHGELDRLLEDPGWQDPREVLDPGGDRGVDTERLTRLCIARLKSLTPKDPEKQRLLTVMERLAGRPNPVGRAGGGNRTHTPEGGGF